MSVEAIMRGTGYPGAVRNKGAATVISTTAQKVKDRFGTDFKDKTGQRARELSSKLHGMAITWSAHQDLPWADRVEGLIAEAGRKIQAGNYSGAETTLSQISVSMYGK